MWGTSGFQSMRAEDTLFRLQLRAHSVARSKSLCLKECLRLPSDSAFPSCHPQEALLAQPSGPVLVIEQGVDDIIAHLLCCIICTCIYYFSSSYLPCVLAYRCGIQLTSHPHTTFAPCSTNVDQARLVDRDDSHLFGHS